MQRGTVDVAIVGGGVIGASIAYFLARQGVSVALIERRLVAQEASWASAGIIAPGGGATMRPEPRYALYAMTQQIYPTLIPQLQEESAVDVEYVRCSRIAVALDPDEAARLEGEVAQHRAQGYRAEWLDPAALREAEPALTQAALGGQAVHAGGTVRAHRLTLALVRAAERRGLRLLQETPALGLVTAGDRVTGVRTTAGTVAAGQTVLAAGAWTRLLGEWVDAYLPTYPVRGQMLAVEQPPVALRNVVTGLGGYILPRGDGTVAAGATEEHESGFDHRVTPTGLSWLVGLLTGLMPSATEARVTATWAGLRPGSPDGMPMIGPVPGRRGLWVAAGHFRSGVQTAPATGTLVADSLVAGRPVEALAPFDPARFVPTADE